VYAPDCSKFDRASFLLTPSFLHFQLVENYARNRHGCFLYLGSVLVDEFGTLRDFQTGLINMLEAFVPHVFDLLKDHESQRNHPDTLDDLFRLCTRFTQRLPVAFLQSPSVKEILELGVMSFVIDHKDANVALCKFWLDFVQLGLEKPKVGC
jgi:transportin-3